MTRKKNLCDDNIFQAGNFAEFQCFHVGYHKNLTLFFNKRNTAKYSFANRDFNNTPSISRIKENIIRMCNGLGVIDRA